MYFKSKKTTEGNNDRGPMTEVEVEVEAEAEAEVEVEAEVENKLQY